MLSSGRDQYHAINGSAENQGAAQCSNIPWSQIAEYSSCLIVALPTAVLNSLAALNHGRSATAELNNIDQLYDLLAESNAGTIFYGVVALTASEAVLFFMNKRYLLPSSQAALDLVRRSCVTVKHKLLGQELATEDRASLGENGLFIWSLTTSLIFAEMGSKALSFFGVPGKAAGFALSFIPYFSTRFAGARSFFSNINSPNARLKQRYQAKLELLSQSLTISEDVMAVPCAGRSGACDEALVRFLQQVDNSWESLPKQQSRVICFRYIAPTIGWGLVASSALPVMSIFMPESVAGAETITQLDIGEDDYYQNPASITFGIFAATLTLFFYEMNIKNMPKAFLQTALKCYDRAIDGDGYSAMYLAGLTVLGFGASYMSGLGFNYIGDLAVESGALSYLGSSISSLMPSGLFMSVVFMLWSHMQDLVNQIDDPVREDVLQSASINRRSALFLLKDSETDISALAPRSNNALLLGANGQPNHQAGALIPNNGE